MEIRRFHRTYGLTSETYHRFRFPYYFQTLFNSLFLLCYSPLWISFHEDSVMSYENPVQKRISAVMVSLVILFTIPTLRGSFQDKIQENPASLFRKFNVIIWAANACVIAYRCWFQQHDVKELVKIPRVLKSFKITVTRGIFLLIIVLYLATSSYLLTSVLSFSITDVMMQGAQTVLLGLSLDQPSNWTDCSSEMKTLIVAAYFFRVYKNIAGYINQVAVLMSCLASYEIASVTLDRVCSKSQTQDDIMELLKFYGSSKQTFAKINRVIGIFVLVVFAASISYTSERLVKILDDGGWVDGILILSFLGSSFGGFFLAAEAHVKMKRTEEFLKQFQIPPQHYYKSECSLCYQPASLYIENSPGQIGLTGGDFFTLTYSLLGQSGSMFLTYIIIMIQFESSVKH